LAFGEVCDLVNELRCDTGNAEYRRALYDLECRLLAKLREMP